MYNLSPMIVEGDDGTEHLIFVDFYREKVYNLVGGHLDISPLSEKVLEIVRKKKHTPAVPPTMTEIVQETMNKVDSVKGNIPNV